MSSEERCDLFTGLFVLFRLVVVQYAILNTRIDEENSTIQACKDAIKQNREEYEKSRIEMWINVAQENRQIMFDHRATLEVLLREVTVLPEFVSNLLTPFKIISESPFRQEVAFLLLTRLCVDLQRNDASFHSSHGFGRLFLLSISTVSPIDRRRAGPRAARHAFLQSDAHRVLLLARLPREIRAEEGVGGV